MTIFTTTSMLYLFMSVLRSRTTHQLSLSPLKENTSRLQEGCHLTLLQVTSAACTWVDSISSLGQPIPELQYDRLAFTFIHQCVALSAPIFTQPSNILCHFKISFQGLLWVANTLPSTRSMAPNTALQDLLQGRLLITKSCLQIGSHRLHDKPIQN